MHFLALRNKKLNCMMETDACTEDRVKTKEWQRPKEQTLFLSFGVCYTSCIQCYLELTLVNHSANQQHVVA
ncbi:unnamed protein product [Pocillopora meandrina]|uniref:Uncharacterized protein n=1 Tax=Pocillopora meandrina TaxID=46732 RepID=A0AAU9VXT0_9CNID|nr:unnamed protein product [Pocillopora meandrina]